jgi:carboxymethylenebutenolidase
VPGNAAGKSAAYRNQPPPKNDQRYNNDAHREIERLKRSVPPIRRNMKPSFEEIHSAPFVAFSLPRGTCEGKNGGNIEGEKSCHGLTLPLILFYSFASFAFPDAHASRFACHYVRSSMTILEPEQTDLKTPFGPMRTYIFRPAEPKRKFPGLVLFSEIFQVTGPIRRTAALLAGHGFVVAAPEIFHELEQGPGVVIPYDQAGADRGNAHKTSKELASYDADARACLDDLKSHAACTGRLGVIGICIGGHLAFRAAMNADVEAGVCLYATDIHKRSLAKGMKDNSLDRMKEITGEMLMIWGRQDPHVPREGRRVVYDAMADANLNFTWHEFNGQHAFIRDEGHRYDSELAMTCYRMAIDLFRRTLGPVPA